MLVNLSQGTNTELTLSTNLEDAWHREGSNKINNWFQSHSGSKWSIHKLDSKSHSSKKLNQQAQTSWNDRGCRSQSQHDAFRHYKMEEKDVFLSISKNVCHLILNESCREKGWKYKIMHTNNYFRMVTSSSSLKIVQMWFYNFENQVISINSILIALNGSPGCIKQHISIIFLATIPVFFFYVQKY